MRRIIVSLFALSLVGAVGACGDTWRGVKKDTGDNVEKTGEVLDKTGEKIKK